jgi:hypothetical protein
MKRVFLFFSVLIFVSISSKAVAAEDSKGWKNDIFSQIGQDNYYLHETAQYLFPAQCPNCRAFSFGSKAGNEEIDLIKKGWKVTSSNLDPLPGKIIAERAKIFHGQFDFQKRSFGKERMKGVYDYFFSFSALPFGNKKDVFKLVRHMSLYSKQHTVIALNFFGPSHDYVIV